MTEKAVVNTGWDSIVVEESAYIDTETIRKLYGQLRNTVGSFPNSQGQYKAYKYKKFWQPPIEIPIPDFYETVSSEQLQYVLERSVFDSSKPKPDLLLFYLDVKAANEKTKAY